MKSSEKNTLSDWLSYISETHPETIEMSLDRIRRVFDLMNLNRLNSDGSSKQVLVVSGTNGKGSTIALIEAGLLSMGLSVGTYTSPHIQHYNERVRINAVPVSNDQLISSFEQVESARKNIPLTYFEFGTLAAFDILFSRDLDVLILEIGLGGRLDAVNIIDSDLAIITSIGLDHTDWLGDTLEQIGQEKAGILRPQGRVLLGENLPENIFHYAEQISCTALRAGEDFARSADGVFLFDQGQSVNYSRFPDIRLPDNNVLLALQALNTLSKSFPGKPECAFIYDSLIDCFNSLEIPGRLEKVEISSLRADQQVYLDVGHNPHAARYLLSFLQTSQLKGYAINVVYSSLADKDVEQVAKILSPVVATWYLAPLGDERALGINALETAVGMHAKNMLSFASLNEALHAALYGGLNVPSITLVFGSFYVIEAAKAYFEGL